MENQQEQQQKPKEVKYLDLRPYVNCITRLDSQQQKTRSVLIINCPKNTKTYFQNKGYTFTETIFPKCSLITNKSCQIYTKNILEHGLDAYNFRCTQRIDQRKYCNQTEESQYDDFERQIMNRMVDNEDSQTPQTGPVNDTYDLQEQLHQNDSDLSNSQLVKQPLQKQQQQQQLKKKKNQKTQNSDKQISKVSKSAKKTEQQTNDELSQEEEQLHDQQEEEQEPNSKIQMYKRSKKIIKTDKQERKNQDQENKKAQKQNTKSSTKKNPKPAESEKDKDCQKITKEDKIKKDKSQTKPEAEEKQNFEETRDMYIQKKIFEWGMGRTRHQFREATKIFDNSK